MTIIHITTSLGGGGAEQMVFQLANQSHKNIRTIVISINSDNTLEEKFKSHHIEYHFLNITSFKNSSLKQGLKQLNFIINDLQNCVFHCHQFHGALLGILYNLFYKKHPLIFTLHSSTIEETNRKILLFITKPFRNIDIVFSKNAFKWFLKNNAVIPNGVDFTSLSIHEERKFQKNDVFRFLFLGRLSNEKNPLSMIEFAENLKEHNVSDFVIDVVGEGILKAPLVEKIVTHHLTNHFNVVGFQQNIHSFLSNAHCLILPSHWEGMPVVLIEAAAAKLPIIATPVGSIPDFLNDSNAFVTPLVNFEKKMVQVMYNYDEAIKKSNILYSEVENNFKIENVYNQHLHLYESLASKQN